MKTSLIIQLVFLAFFCLASKCSAGGPSNVVDGMAVILENNSFTYRYDKGTLGNLNNQEAIELVESALNFWRGIKTSKLEILKDTKQFVDEDINGLNFKKFIANVVDNNRSTIIFDDDGSILKSLKREPNNVAGAGLLLNRDIFGDESPEAKSSIIILNGLFINGIKTKRDPEMLIEDFKSVIIHELGHAFGLAHSQINIEALNDKTIPVPVMFPTVNNIQNITVDDIASLSFLYPNEEELNKFGSIEGFVVTDTGNPVLGTNVIAREINNPRVQVVSSVSDHLKNKNGSFILNALPPGKYRLEIEPIEPLFVAGSRVGHYADNISDKSFQFVTSKRFYSSQEIPASKDETEAQIFEIKEGDRITDINIIAPVEKEIESNNTKEEAQEIILPNTIKGQVSLNESGDQKIDQLDGSDPIEIKDYFKFHILKPTLVRVVLTETNNRSVLVQGDISFYLFNQEGKVLDFYASHVEKSSIKDLENKRIIQEILPEGEYTIGVASTSVNPDSLQGLGGSSFVISNYNIGISLSNVAEDIKKIQKIILIPPDNIALSKDNIDTPVITVKTENFTKATTCKIKSRDKNIRLKPSRFLLDSNSLSKEIKISLTNQLRLKREEDSAIILVEVECENGVREDTGIIISN